MWEPPPIVGALNGLYYHVIVVNNDTGVVIVNNSTTKTNYTLPDVQLCQNYTANVTACSTEYCGDSIVYGQSPPGGVCACVYVFVRVCVHACMRVFVCVHVCVLCVCVHAHACVMA